MKKQKSRNSKYQVAFRVRHPSMDPEEICAALGMEATHMWAAKDSRCTPQGFDLPGFFNETYCCFELDDSQKLELNSFIRQWNNKLRNHKDYLYELCASGGKLEYFIACFSQVDPKNQLDERTIQELSRMNLDLLIDCCFEGQYGLVSSGSPE